MSNLPRTFFGRHTVLTAYCLALVSFFALTTQGQTDRQLKLSWGEEVRSQKKTSLSKVLGMSDEKLYSIETTDRGSRSQLVLHDERFEKLASKDLHEMLKMESGHILYEVLLYNQCLYAIIGKTEGKLKTHRIYVQSIDKEKLTTSGKERLVAEVGLSGFKYQGRVFVHRSKENKKALLLFELETKEKQETSVASVVFDAFMNVESRQTVTLSDNKKSSQLAAYEIDNWGSLYLLFRTGRNSGPKDIDAYYELFASDETTELRKLAEVRTAGRFLNDLDVTALAKNKVLLTGTTSENNNSGILGTLFMEVDASTGVVSKRHESSLSSDLLMMGFDASQERRARRDLDKGKTIELDDHYLRRVIPTPDGGAILLTEQEYSRQSTAQGAFYDPTMISTTYHHYNDILVIHLSAEGEIDWSHKVLKRQMSTNDDGFYSSFASAYVDSTLYLMYHDDPQNAYADKLDIIRTAQPGSENGVVDLVTIDSEGRMGESIFMKNMNSSVTLRPKVMFQTGNDRMVIYGESKRSRRYGLLKFE